MAEITYNSWSDAYKNPFGAVILGTPIDFHIDIKTDNQIDVKLVTQFENGFKSYENMTRISEHSYHLRPENLTEIGFYKYYFQIIERDQLHEYHYFYGASQIGGGIGTTYADENSVVPYTQTLFLKAEQAPNWYRDAIFYQIFPDSFARNDLINNQKSDIFFYGKETDSPYYIKEPNGDITRWTFYGGNLAGIIDKIPYLKSLGVTALYLNPIFEARSSHRYDTSDYHKIDSLLGTTEDFERLVKTLHAHEMHIVLDGVFSHVGRNSVYFDFDGKNGGNGAYQSRQSPYIDWFSFDNYPESYKSWWGIKDLPTIDKHQKSYQDFIYGKSDSVLSKWNSFGVDGWRLDVADELPDDFIKGIRATLSQEPDKVLIGEVWEDASRKIAYDQYRKYIYGDALHATMNYPFRDLILGLLTGAMTPETAAGKLMQLYENYPTDIFLNNFNNIGTHDTERILTMLGGNTAKLNLAVGLLMTLPGVPVIYYGDEAGLTGHKDPENRAFFPWESINPVSHQIYKNWIAIRKSAPILATGDLSVFYSDQFFGFVRSDGAASQSSATFVFNLSDQGGMVDPEKLTFLTKSIDFVPFFLAAFESSYKIK
ncbi:glycoside hydrolase family 13 protein [Lactococcus insecticola]|uniref:Alpha-amylase n=1 Tax=Pseudolactococcus insecticola TaxID=2709158 RepID=A0A6A0B3B7_9LACT|nr:glycoside hydrolase family 13 protein [Lactococcus insecticola]GFH39632.1 alpha-amylase [Lactococcus insecticola]